MNTGLILVLCALFILVLVAFWSWRKSTSTNIMDANSMGYVSPDANTHENSPIREGQFASTPAPNEEVLRYIAAGEKIQAIKAYREQTGLGLSEAKRVVDSIDREQLALVIESSRNTVDGPLPGAGAPNEEVLRYMAEGRKIQAIKAYREQTGVSLSEAKRVVDAIERELPVPAGESSWNAVSGSSSGAGAPNDEVLRYMAEGRKIQAIKAYREQTGLGLKQAKDVIDRLV